MNLGSVEKFINSKCNKPEFTLELIKDLWEYGEFFFEIKED
jgi:hypothetical protein